MTNKKKRIVRGQIRDTVGDLSNVRRMLRERLPREDWFAPNDHILCFWALRQFNFRRPIENSEADVARGCRDILQRFQLSTESPVQTFRSEVLGFRCLPRREREALRERTVNDLRAVERLIAKYEGNLAVQRFREDGQQGRNQSEMTQITFYRRCLNEREAIVKFLIDELDEMALRHASEDYHWSQKMMPFLVDDATYVSRYPWGLEQLDHERINTCRHRLLELPVTIGSELANLYARGEKVSFYRRLHRHVSPATVFSDIQRSARAIPEVSGRGPIFDELEYLYRRRRWLAFYALCLPQVEGIFSEMLRVAEPLKTTNGALPEKVRRLRRFYRFHKSSFDYFEHHLPLRRNRFSHSGKEDDVWSGSQDLLHDLRFLLEVFSELEVPLVTLRRIIQRRAPSDFDGIADFNTFFDLLEAVKTNKQMDDVGDDLAAFKAEFIQQTLGFESRLPVILTALDQQAETFVAAYSRLTAERLGKAIDLRGDRKAIKAVEDGARDAMVSLLEGDDEEPGPLIRAARAFVKRAVNHLPALSQNATKLLKDAHDRQRELWSRIDWLSQNPAQSSSR